MEMNDIVVISGARTPMGSFGGTLKDITAFQLGGIAAKEALKRANLGGGDLDDVILGSCRQAGNGPNPARSAALLGGIPDTVPAITLNMACPSGMRALAMAAQSIRLGEAGVMLIGGFDSMSTIPYLLKDARWQGFKMGNKVLMDGWSDSIDPVSNMGMGQTAENLVEKYDLSREEMDEFAYSSHQKAAEAQDKGLFEEEIVSVEVPQRKADPIIFSKDETIRRNTTLEKLARLPAVFKKDGKITAGNACGMSDGAVAMVVTSREKASELGADYVVNLQKEDMPALVNSLSDGYGADVFLECAGAPRAADLGLNLLRKSGRYTQVGLFSRPINLDFEKIAYKELIVTGTFSQRWTAWKIALRLLNQGKVRTSPLISDILPLAEWETGFKKHRAKEGLKIILKP